MQPADISAPRHLIDLLRQPHRPRMASIAALVPAADHDGPISALVNAATVLDDEQRTADAARVALRWGTAMISVHTDTTPTAATAIYCGAIRLAGYLGGKAVARYCDTHPSTGGDTTLRHHVDALTNRLGHDPTADDDQAMLTLGLRLRRHLTTCGYTSPDLYAVTLFSGIGKADASCRAAAIGHLAHQIMDEQSRYSCAAAIMEAIREAPLPQAYAGLAADVDPPSC
ncbi:hypothetical protein ACQP2X_39805 [Actinoplanes sp. CA-131856]